MKRIFALLFLISLSAPVAHADPVLDEKYKAGVKSFLEGDARKAISTLSDVVRADASHEKARNMLLKLYTKELNGLLAAGKTADAKRFYQEALSFFPDNRDLIFAGAALKETQRREAPPREAASRVERKIETPIAAAAPAAPALAVSVPAAVPAAGKETAISFLWIALTVFIFLLVASFIFMLILDRKKLWEKLELHDERMRLKEEKEKVLESDLASLKAQVQQKEAQLRQRADELQALKRELEQKRKDPPPVVMPSMAAPLVQWPGAPRAVVASRPLARQQEQQILDIVVDAPSLVKREAWERIAERSLSLYQTSPADAVKFLEQLAGDSKPQVRMSIVMSLARIASTETVDIMLKMMKDADFSVQREVIKGLKTILAEKVGSVPEPHMEKIKISLAKELQDGGWVV